ncbi:MAG: DNA-directed RNA polymerase subunit beta [Coriobacteriia bacterium]|nr:DNA-directed RNA polymerase subunit beta [Coriobacteriia bacterium]
MGSPTQIGNVRNRRTFAKNPEILPVPNLIAIQLDSFKWFMEEGLAEVLADASPISDRDERFHVIFGDYVFSPAKHTVDECKEKGLTYQRSLLTNVSVINRETGEELRKNLIYMGDFPVMTERATFVINGSERVIVSLLQRSPGVYFSVEERRNKDEYFTAELKPHRGAPLAFEFDKTGAILVNANRSRKVPVTMFIRAMGLAETDKEILALFNDSEAIKSTLVKDHTETRDEALIELYKHLRPGDLPSVDTALSWITSLYYSESRYDLARVGRYQINKKFSDISEEYKTDLPDEMTTSLTPQDILSTLRYLIALGDGKPGHSIDDVDHLGNRRVSTAGELIQNRFRIGISRMRRTVSDRLATLNPEEISPENLINIRPISASIKEFFGSSQLSQFMDQTNPVAGIAHKRRLSAIGPGGIRSAREAKIEVRDVHPSHYGRICPIETPEGMNIGLIGSLATYAQVNKYGFIETPYRVVKNGKVTDEIHYLTADKEEKHVIAQASEPFDKKTGKFGNERILCRVKGAGPDGEFGEPDERAPEDVDYMDVSPRQMVSAVTALIPFLEHDDANRALMGANMQRQAVPLMKPAAPLVGTGLEGNIAVDSGEVFIAKHAGVVEEVDAEVVNIRTADGTIDTYTMPKFRRSNQSTCINHRPIVVEGQIVEEGDPIADGPSTESAELALGQNLLVAFMPWEGYNYEDAIILSERCVRDDLLTSIHIKEYEIEARDTKVRADRDTTPRAEEITREIPNTSEDMLANLDETGIIRIGTEVGPGDILVGKVTPKGGSSSATAEQRLLEQIFGTKVDPVRDSSLRVPHGISGRVIDVQHIHGNEDGVELKRGVNELVRVFIAQKRKIQVGDKLAGRHGNKGVISKILSIEDMPFLVDGTPVDIILNPMGVPSRMNVGQLLETHLGYSAGFGWSDDPKATHSVPGGLHVSTPVFDGAKEDEISNIFDLTNKNLELKAHERFGDQVMTQFVPKISRQGKIELISGRTGEPFDEPVTVGEIYILKLHHLVDDKIHARSTGPYSLVTQQPLGGKAQFGGQRFGEMEVWALYAYGAAYLLREMLTVKSDDLKGRIKAYEAIVKGENIPEPGMPESFNVLVRELGSLCLKMDAYTEDGSHINLMQSRVERPTVREEVSAKTVVSDLEDEVTKKLMDADNIDMDFDALISTDKADAFDLNDVVLKEDTDISDAIDEEE